MNLGAIERKLDLRDIKLGAVQAPVSVPDTYLTDLSVYPKYFQGQQPACGAHSATTLKVVQEAKEYGSVPNFSPRFVWWTLKTLEPDGFALTDGTDMRSIFKRLQSYGICDFDLIGNDVSLPLGDYAEPNVPQSVRDNATPREVGAYAFSLLDWDSIKQAIYQNGVAIALIKVDNGFFGTTNPTFTTPKYGHFVAFVNYDQNGVFIIDSTESDTSKSVKYIKREYLTSPFLVELGTCLDLPDETISTLINKRALLQKLVSLYQQLLTLLKGR